MTELIAPQIGPAAAISAVILRLVWLAAELAVSVVLYFCRPWRKRGETARSLTGD